MIYSILNCVRDEHGWSIDFSSDALNFTPSLKKYFSVSHILCYLKIICTLINNKTVQSASNDLSVGLFYCMVSHHSVFHIQYHSSDCFLTIFFHSISVSQGKFSEIIEEGIPDLQSADAT